VGLDVRGFKNLEKARPPPPSGGVDALFLLAWGNLSFLFFSSSLSLSLSLPLFLAVLLPLLCLFLPRRPPSTLAEVTLFESSLA